LVSYSVSVRLEHGAMTSFPRSSRRATARLARRLRVSRVIVPASWARCRDCAA